MNIQKSFLNLIGIILIIIILGGGVYFYIQNNSTEDVQGTVYKNEIDKSKNTEKQTKVPEEVMEEKVSENATGIIKSVYSKDGKNFLDIDYIELNSNWKPGGESNGPVYTNVNPKIRTFEISSESKFLIGSGAYESVSLQKFKSVFDNAQGYQRLNPWKIVVANNLVTEVREYYLP